MEIINILPFEKMVIIAPHPDDESIGCGGLLLKYSSQCDVICITDGRQGQGDVTPKKLADIRSNEFANAMLYAKPHDYMFLNIEDGTLCAHLDVLKEVDFSRYNRVFVTGFEDRHPDHTAALTALKRACMGQGSEPEIYIYEVHRKMEHVTHVLPIGDIIEKKQELIRCYLSQITNIPFDEKVLEINKTRGICNDYGEGFRKIELCDIPDEIPLETEISKMREYYWVYTRWMNVLQSGRSIADILKKLGNTSVVIYGFKEIGQLLWKELINAGIEVPLIVDRRNINYEDRVKIVCPEGIPQDMKDVMIIVTATWYIDDIRTELAKSGICRIISIKELLEEYECS